MKKLLILKYVFLISFLSAQSPYLDSLKLLFKNATQDTFRLRVLNALVQEEYDLKIWPKYNEQIREIAEKNLAHRSSPLSATDLVFMKYLSGYYGNIGYMAYHHETNIPKAIEYFNKAIKMDKEIDYKEGIADNYNGLAVIYSKQGNVSKALEYLYLALKIKEDLKDKNGIGVVLSSIGGIYLTEKEDEKSLECYEKSLGLFESVKNQTGIANSLNNIAHIYSGRKQYDKALKNYSKALKMVEEVGNKIAMAGVLISIGRLYYSQNDPACDSTKVDCTKLNLLNAKNSFLKALNLSEESKNGQTVATSKNMLGQIEFKLGNYKQAIKYGEDALQIAEKLGFPVQISSAAELLYLVEKKEGNTAKAFEYFQQFIKMRDSVKNDENSKVFMKQQMQYDYNKQKEIDQAKYDKEIGISEERENKQKWIIAFVGVGLFLVICFAIIIFNRLRITNKQKEIIQEQKEMVDLKNELIEVKQKEILDSIHYAKRIQSTLLAHRDFVNEHIPSNFIYFQPKDIVSGDFYWATSVEVKSAVGSKQSELSTANRKLFYLAVCDSTGHGVPGAFMSLLNITFLNEAINEKGILETDEVFNFVRKRLIETISKEGQKDGFDGAIMCLDKINSTITYTAANVKPILISNNKVIELQGDKMPVGKGEKESSFTKHKIDYNKNDRLYLYTDGYADQFGGPQGKKFKYKQLNELLVSISHKSLQEQSVVIEETFNNWKGNLEQLDDVCIIGISL